MFFPSLNAIKAAHSLIRPLIERTPILHHPAIDTIAGRKVFFKCENLQPTGAFKIRGATHAVLSLDKKQAENGVATHSSGNHAIALAYAAAKNNIDSFIVMPHTAPAIKKQLVQEYGARITFCEPTLKSREETLQSIQQKTGAVFIHPYNNEQVIMGQATVALEIFDQISEPQTIIAPVGGGGLMSGICLAGSQLSSRIRFIAAEPQKADDAYRSLKTGKIQPSFDPQTIADGLKTSLGDKTFPIIQRYVDDIILCSEQSIVEAMKMIWQRLHIIIEPSAAVPFAALLENPDKIKSQTIVLVLSGGNVDFDRLPWN
ncbi:pyridoxal-phosphate dependent enzyme [candidate division KSB1 bacterium]|nr:pyridoxal-phosphate dependent enzyme [candidate division KSB1 bacterium]